MSKDFLDESVVPPLSSGPGDWRLSDSIKRSALLRTKLLAPCVTLASIIRSWTLSWSQWYSSLLRAFRTENSFLFIRRLKYDFAQGGNASHALIEVHQANSADSGRIHQELIVPTISAIYLNPLLWGFSARFTRKITPQSQLEISPSKHLVFIEIRGVCNEKNDN